MQEKRCEKSERTKETMSESKAGQKSEKTIYFEICRIIAVFCIMFQHTGARGADAWTYTESTWVYMMSSAGRVISGIGVPLFWMVSGALLLPKKETWKKVYGKRVPRITCVLVIFSVIRYFYLWIVEGLNGYVGEFFRRFYTQEIFLPYWFLYEYLGILLVLPFLRKMMQNLTEQEERLLPVLLLGWNVLNDISNIVLGAGFVIDLHFRSSISYFLLGYLMEDCRMLKQSGRRELRLGMGWAALAAAVLNIWVCSRYGSEVLESLTMLLTISVYYLIRYMGGKRIWNNTLLHFFILWCGSNVFGIYLIEDYLRNATAFIWEWSAPYVSPVPACCPWLLSVFLLGNVLVSGVRRLPVLKNLL